jgi:hypothetical protein
MKLRADLGRAKAVFFKRKMCLDKCEDKEGPYFVTTTEAWITHAFLAHTKYLEW